MVACKVCQERDDKSKARKEKAAERKAKEDRNSVDTAFKEIRTAKNSLVKMMRKIRTSVDAHHTNGDLQRLAQELLQEVRSELDKTQPMPSTSPETPSTTKEVADDQ